jgi:23S rRNA pseudouridine2604 synthase
MEQVGVRINKYLSAAGVCSRREADRALSAGQIRIGEHTASLGDRVYPGDRVFYKGKPVCENQQRILIAFHKPRGVVCTTSKKEGVNIVDYIGYPKRIYPVGRLDKDSTGLILLTNDGDIVNKMMRAGNRHEKEYVVTTDRKLTRDFIMQMQNGVPILDTVTRPCQVWRTGDKEFHIILTQGLNRQIRRMCQYLGYQVMTLKRIRIMNISLGKLKEGTYRAVTKQEWQKLQEQIRDSVSETVILAGKEKDQWQKTRKQNRPMSN